MTYTKEDIERLVPEAVGTIQAWITSHLSQHRLIANALLTTRRQLEIAQQELETISKQQDYEMALDPTWAKRIALHALTTIEDLS